MSNDASSMRGRVDEAGEGQDSTTPQSGALEQTSKKIPPQRPWAALILLVAVVILGAVGWVFRDAIGAAFGKKPVAVTQDAPAKQSVSAFDRQKASDPELARFVTPTTGETWLTSPKDIAPQGWFKAEQLSSYADINTQGYSKTAQQQLEESIPIYREVGSRNGAAIIYAFSPSYGVGGLGLLFEKGADGQVTVLVNPQNMTIDDMVRYVSDLKTDVLTAKVTNLDQTTHYDSLNLPQKIVLPSGEFVLRPSYVDIADTQIRSFGQEPGTTKTLIYELGASRLYKVERTYADTGLTNIGYVVRTPFNTGIGVAYTPNKLSLEGYSFTNNPMLQYKDYQGKQQYDELVAIARGCGGATAAVSRSDRLKDSDLVVVGKTDTGRDVYEPVEKNSALYKKAYDEYKQSWSPDVVPFGDYVAQHGLVVIKNSTGERLVYVRGRYAMAGGCAKPVVYLYPPSPMLVSVSVGANVTESDPQYEPGGWKYVLARPSGQLIYKGKPYDSLFWEGQGHGAYPGIVSGTIVKRADAAATIRRQLGEQGLNQKEINDFMAFWESKIPNKPYIRLTWLSTEQMNILAPLRISPKPATMIRVFLDMDGFDTAISLPSQKLTATPRHGFTVVEWGGLTSEIRH